MQATYDGDTGFVGVNERLAPDRLPPGIASRAVNLRFRTGEAVTRGGITIRHIGPAQGGRLPFGSPHGATVYRTSDGQQWIIVAASGKVYRAKTHQTAEEIPLPSGVVLQNPIEFTQAGNNLYMFRGANASVLELQDGNWTTGFTEVTQATSQSGNGTGTLTIPNGKRGMYFQERLWVVTDAGVYISDVRNFTRYSLLNAFRIESGSNDELVSVAPFGFNSMIAFKTRSVHGRYNLVPDNSGNLSAAYGDVISQDHGVVAPDAVVQAGRDLFYVGQNGLTSIQLTEENRLKSIDVPLSQDMAALWRRINWAYMARSKLAYWDSRIYWSVPVDGARVGNCVAVYDLQTRTWQGTDEGVALTYGIVDWFIADYGGEPRLFCLDGQGLVRLYEESHAEDERQGTYLTNEQTGAVLLSESDRTPLLAENLTVNRTAIQTTLTTRGYDLGVPIHKRFAQMETQVAAAGAAVAFAAKVEGVAESYALSPGLSPDRTAYTTWNGGTWTDTNANDDFDDEHRADYSVVLPASGLLLQDGIVLNRMQTWDLARRINKRGRYCQVTITNTSGFISHRSVQVKAVPVADNQRQKT